MQNLKQYAWIITGFIIAVMIGLIFKTGYLISNAYFIVGMVGIFTGIIMILSHSRLFVGWRKNSHRKDQTDAETLNPELNDLRSVASKKNEPIQVSKWARLALIIGAVAIVASVIVSLF